MHGYPNRSNQIIPSFVPHDKVSENNGNRGETAPEVRHMLDSQYGRSVAGLGRSEYAGDVEYVDDQLDKLESQDDVVGSGIFDTGASSSTIHVDMGVFQDHPNLPGYIAREVQFEPNEDVESLPSGADIIAVPGGGMTWGGRLIGPGTYGEHVPYRAGSQVVQPPSPMRPVGRAASPAAQERPRAVPTVVTTPSRPLVPAKKPCNCPAAAPQAPRRAWNPARNVTPMVARPGPLRGMGADATGNGQPPAQGSSWVPWVAGSALIGVAVALFAGTLSIKPGKSSPRRRK